MARINQSDWPYLVRDTDKDYMQVLYKPGVPLQNSELNESQLILKGIIKGVADTILTDGDIREGVQPIVNSDNTVTLTNGKIYLEGAIHNFYEQTIPITGVGEEKIGVVIDEKAISSKEDKALVSPASGMPAYGMSGADRLEVTVLAKINDPEATTLYTLIDGKLVEEQKASEEGTFMHRLNEILARRTYDESGHYKVWGLEMSQKYQYDDENLYVSLSEGKAYVEGYEILKNTATTIPIKRTKALRDIAHEPKIYQSEHKRYKLNNEPANQVKSVMGTIAVKTTLTRQGAVNGSDPIPSKYTPAVDIQEIKDTTSARTYVKNVDYVFERDTVRWTGNGEQPDLGTTYEITFTYNKELKEGEDYNFKVEGNEYFIEILSGDKPVENSTILIDYDFQLYQIHTITMDKNGIVHVAEGQADTVDKVVASDITDQDVLVLGYVLTIPQSDNLQIYNVMNTRSSMARIQAMFERLVDMETNIAISDLEREAIEGSQATELKGIFTDGFLGWSKSDVNHPEYNASIDPYLNNLLTGYESTPHELTIDKTKGSNFREYNRIVTASGTEGVTDQQPYATQSQLINPYTVFKGRPVVVINPRVDNWTETERVTIQQDGGVNVERDRINETRTETVRRTVDNRDLSDSRKYNRNWRANDTSSVSTFWSTSQAELTGSQTRTEVDYTTSTSTTDTAIEYMRQRSIDITISNLNAYENAIRITFNDIEVTPTAISSDYEDSSGSLKADKNGVVKARFTIPKGIRCGTVSVRAWSENAKNLVGQTSFTANGTLRTHTTTLTKNTTLYITDIYTTTRTQTITTTKEREFRYVDPVSQTFELPQDQQITSVGLYFSHVDNYPITVQIRETDNAYPADSVLAEKIIMPEDLKGSSNATEETVVKFNDPIYCEGNKQYAITILCESSEAGIWIQELGKKDVRLGEIIARNPYIPGTMFTSSNALTWTAHQTKNIKFRLYSMEYEEEAQVYFSPIKNISYDRIQLLADTSVPANTKLEWEYSSDNEGTWLPLAINTIVDMDREIDNIAIRANMKTNGRTSPAFASDSLLLIGYKNDESSAYVSRNIQLEKSFNNVRVVADVDSPSGTGVTFYYATDINGNNWKPLNQSGSGLVKVQGGLTEYTYTDTLLSGAKNFRIKVEMTSNNPTAQPAVRGLKCIMS